MYKLILLSVICVSISSCAGTSKQIMAIQEGDAELSCEGITAEKEQMNQIIAKIQQKNTTSHVANVGTALGGHAVSMSGMPIVGSVIGNIGGLSSMNAEQRKEHARQAQMRLSTLNGLAMGKQCSTSGVTQASEKDNTQ